MKYLALILFLILCTPCAPLADAWAGPLPPGAVLLARGNGEGQRPPSGTVVITGRDGKVTGVEKRPGEGRREENGERNQGQGRNQSGSGNAPGNRPK